MPTREDALKLARVGWAVLPLRGKVPITPHGVKDATTDPAQIAAWWSGTNHNIGAQVPTSLVVLDLDPQNGGSFAALEELAGVALPETLTTISGRGGGGQHRYYLRPEGRVGHARLPAGIDVKTSAGYCVMPPSLHPLTGQPYTWEHRAPVPLPREVSALLLPARVPSRPVGPREPGKALERRALRLARYVSELPEGRRNAGLFWAACRLVEDGHPDSSWDVVSAAAEVAGLEEREVRRTLESARRTAARS